MFRFLSCSHRNLFKMFMKIVSHAHLLANAIAPTHECAMLICPMCFLQFSRGPILNKKMRATLSVVNLIAHAIGVRRNILTACNPCINIFHGHKSSHGFAGFLNSVSAACFLLAVQHCNDGPHSNRAKAGLCAPASCGRRARTDFA